MRRSKPEIDYHRRAVAVVARDCILLGWHVFIFACPGCTNKWLYITRDGERVRIGRHLCTVILVKRKNERLNKQEMNIWFLVAISWRQRTGTLVSFGSNIHYSRFSFQAETTRFILIDQLYEILKGDGV